MKSFFEREFPRPHEQVDTDRPHEVPGAERYAAFGLRMKQLFAVKAKLMKANMAAAATKAKTAALANARYTAYSSDVGEALRPIVPDWAVKGTYGLAVAYIVGDVGYTGYKESLKPDGNTTRALTHAAVFQGVASLALPMCSNNHCSNPGSPRVTRPVLSECARLAPHRRQRLVAPCYRCASPYPMRLVDQGDHSSGGAWRSIRDQAPRSIHQVGPHARWSLIDSGAAIRRRRAVRACHRCRV